MKQTGMTGTACNENKRNDVDWNTLKPPGTLSIPVSATNSSYTYKRVETTGDHAQRSTKKGRLRARRIPPIGRMRPRNSCCFRIRFYAILANG